MIWVYRTVELRHLPKIVPPSGNANEATVSFALNGGPEVVQAQPQPSSEASGTRLRKTTSPKITILQWSLMDDFVLGALTDDTIRVWESRTGILRHTLAGHSGLVFVMDTHPFDARIILSAGHDGRIFLWDIYEGTCIRRMPRSLVVPLVGSKATVYRFRRISRAPIFRRPIFRRWPDLRVDRSAGKRKRLRL